MDLFQRFAAQFSLQVPVEVPGPGSDMSLGSKSICARDSSLHFSASSALSRAAVVKGRLPHLCSSELRAPGAQLGECSVLRWASCSIIIPGDTALKVPGVPVTETALVLQGKLDTVTKGGSEGGQVAKIRGEVIYYTVQRKANQNEERHSFSDKKPLEEEDRMEKTLGRPEGDVPMSAVKQQAP